MESLESLNRFHEEGKFTCWTCDVNISIPKVDEGWTYGYRPKTAGQDTLASCHAPFAEAETQPIPGTKSSTMLQLINMDLLKEASEPSAKSRAVPTLRDKELRQFRPSMMFWHLLRQTILCPRLWHCKIHGKFHG